MAMFNIGDVIRVKSNGFNATVLRVDTLYGSTLMLEIKYGVYWHLSGMAGDYLEEDVKNDWVLETILGNATNSNVTVATQAASSQYSHKTDPVYGFRIDTASNKKECDHKWVEIGFTSNKTVCYYCDKEKM
jgi:hypothetical protein